MLKRLFLITALIVPALLLSGGVAHASDGDIGGAPVKAIDPEPTYSTIYSATYIGTPLFYGTPQTIIITPVVPYDSITVTTGNTRLELVTPAPYVTYSMGGYGLGYGHPNPIILTQPGAIYQTSSHHHHGVINQVSNCRSSGSLAPHSIRVTPGSC